MDFKKIEGANIVLAQGQAEYETIVGRYAANTRSLHAQSGEEYNSGPSITVAFNLTLEEKVALLNNATLYLRVLGGGFPPVALWVE